ncbi:Calmodulin [Spironucleus salmonicida]|uniref:Calmodulin n=1 Tax=Spironucleus salmonicida TaxID=348837 RepID=V6LVH3_9EUKA|nr:Calmodulin [Spironucleus salmonicida]|eukprot:EST48647.1 Calmodulin [Spironucleus salmonicida]
MIEISQQLRTELYETFKAFDIDGNGFVDLNEIETMLKSLHIKYNVDTIVKNMNKIDDDGNGYMDFEEFCKFMVLIKPKDKEVELKNIFKLVDTDDSGEIDRTELQELLVNIGHMKLSDQEIDDCFEILNISKSGLISFQEFHDFFQDCL